MLLATLENLLNRGLPRSPRAQGLCRELAGRSLGVAIPELVTIRIHSTGLVLTLEASGGLPGALEPGAAAAAPDALLVGGPLSLLALARGDARRVLQQGHVRISGDAELAGRFRELLSLLAPDWEEELALVLGDVAAHRLAGAARAARDWARMALRTGLENVAEYLAHERRDLVPRAECAAFLREVDVLREDADRLEARIALLERRAVAG